MRNKLCLAALALTSTFYSQKNTWQQKVDYSIIASLDDQKALVAGEETIEYTNNSKDSLSEIYLHLYWNAFKKGSHAFTVFGNDQSEMDASDFGSITLSEIKIDGQSYTAEVFESIGKIKLKSPIAPLTKTRITIAFISQIPACLNRAGKNNTAGTDFTLTQWYPKICRYDAQGIVYFS